MCLLDHISFYLAKFWQERGIWFEFSPQDAHLPVSFLIFYSDEYQMSYPLLRIWSIISHHLESTDGKESALNAGDLVSFPGLGKSPGGGPGNPVQYFCLENRSLAGHSPWGCKESHMTERLSRAQLTVDHFPPKISSYAETDSTVQASGEYEDIHYSYIEIFWVEEGRKTISEKVS